jgi:hypothetical protein
VTFIDLKKRVRLEATTQQQQRQQHQSKLFERLHNKPFWIWNVEEHKQEDIKTNGDCCFNHIIGLPTKERMEKKQSSTMRKYYTIPFWLTTIAMF